MNNDSINSQVMALWEEYFARRGTEYVPLIYPELQTNALLFVGLNPSFGARWSFLKGTEYSSIKPNQFFAWKNRARFDLEKAKGIERIAKKEYGYFREFVRISNHMGVLWEHVDLFFYRTTSQKAFKRIIFRGNELNDFGMRQLDLSTRLIELLEPKAIVVVNALASHILEKDPHSKFHVHFNEQLGTHTIELNGESVPTFLGSMLTGQRALDVYSRLRLQWHIKKVLGA